MNLKLLNYLFISLFISFVFAISEDEIAIANSDVTASDLEGDCKDIASLVRGTKILKCLVNDKQKISTLEIFNIKYQTTIDDIGKLTDIENLRVVYESSCFIYTGMYNITSYSPLENLKKLTYYHEDSAIPFHPVSREKYSIILKAKISSLKKLKFNNLVVYDDDIEQIVSQFQNIEELEFEKCLFNHKNNDYEGFKELKHLKILTIGNTTSVGSRLEKIPNVFSLKDLKKLNLPYNTITVIPSDIKNLKNLEYLNLQNNYLEKIPEEISVLTKLEYLNLQRNRIDDIIPESLNKLSNLKYIYLDNNRNIQGKTLINDSLIECKYQSNYSLCKAKDMSCFVKDYKYENCDNTSEIPISTNDQCGKEYGRCPSGKCCSKYGYCGTSDKHCGNGCQSEFGKCNENSSEIPISTNDQCGKEYGRCPSGKCCSKYGYCGTSDKHCGNGCQSEFGKCSSNNNTTKKTTRTTTKTTKKTITTTL